MKILLTLLLVAVAAAGMAQTPKKHIFYDTVKTIKQRIDYAPDTIPVLFVELKKENDSTVSFSAVKGFVIWQTYRKPDTSVFGMTFDSTRGNWCCQTIQREPEFDTQEYEPSKGMQGIFLYADRKTHVTNKVIYSFKR